MAKDASPWNTGDFHFIGLAHAVTSEILCEDCGIGAGQHVLDVACGSGNTAIAAARRGARAAGIDIVENLIRRARKRAEAEGLSIDFETGDAERLPFESEVFDCVLSTFGVMFAPDQSRAANELLRVCKPGGTIALSNWTLESYPGSMFALAAAYLPPAGNARAPIEWGTVPGLQRLFGNRVTQMSILDRSVRLQFVNVDQMLATFKAYFGPVRALFEGVPPERHPQLDRELRDLMLRYNRAPDGTQSTAMTYINVVMTKPPSEARG